MEQQFLISVAERQTPCIVREPDYGAPQRIVVGVHGIGGSMRDPIQVSIAEEMEMFGAVSLRFDLPAHGENDEEILSLRGCVDTLLDVAEFALARYPDVEDLCIFATDFGAYVTLTAMADLIELDCRVRLVIQTPSLHMDQSVLTMAHVSPVTLEAMEMALVNTPRPLGIFNSFYEELRDNDILAAYPIPFLILHGENDAFVPMADIQNLRNLNDRARLVVIPGAGHQFQEPGAWDMVLDLTRDWFSFEQVILADEYK
ncbi:MAG: alpha/beta fold hydrolase [Oscillospiraceae bacterium]|nr:alpha/beta fold hydrolase [Oscillospiraceae bacterium]